MNKPVRGLWRWIDSAAVVAVIAAVASVTGGVFAYKSAKDAALVQARAVDVQAHAVDAQYVVIAVGILEKPKQSKDDVLREWAVELLDKKSPVPLSKKLRDRLINGEVLLSGSGSGIEAPDKARGYGNVGLATPTGKD